MSEAELLDDYEAMKESNLRLVGQVSALKAENRTLRDKLIRWEVWEQFYGRLKSVRADAPDTERVLKQAKIIGDMQRRIRFQRAEINRLIPIDRMQRGRHFPDYNVYRHCNKLRNMWLEAEQRLKEFTGH